MTQIISKVTVTAGGVVINHKGQVLVVNQNGTSWSLPKGHVEPGEEPLDAARREIHEESGLSQVQYQATLGAYGRYKIGKNLKDDKSEWKILLSFLFKTRQMDLKPLDPQNPQARWVDVNKVESLLTSVKDKSFFKSISSMIQ